VLFFSRQFDQLTTFLIHYEVYSIEPFPFALNLVQSISLIFQIYPHLKHFIFSYLALFKL